MSVDFTKLADAVFEGAVRGLSRGAKIVETRAKARAPVRNIFGRGYSFRAKTAAEFQSGLRFVSTSSIEDMLRTGDIGAFGDTVAWERYRTIGTKRMRRDWHDRRAGEAERHLADYEAEMGRRKAGGVPEPTFLTRQGAYEVRHKRAGFSTWGHSHVGGRLRGEITSTGASVSGQTAEAWVISPTPYGKYQEFGTRHNRAHPYLRPALAESRSDVVAQIAAAVQEATRSDASNIVIEVEVRL